jgi:hypothetical protein
MAVLAAMRQSALSFPEAGASSLDRSLEHTIDPGFRNRWGVCLDLIVPLC